MNSNTPPSLRASAPLDWLARGWADLLRNPVPGLIHGLVMAAFGGLLFWAARDRFWLLAGAFSGFLIVAPILATGLYRVSKAAAEGRKIGMSEILQLWLSGDRRLMRFGILLALAGTAWVLTSAGLITLWSPVPIRNPQDFLQHVVLAGHFGIFEAWLALGALLAAPVFASSVITIPMLADTQVTLYEAVTSSWRAVAEQPLPMVIWASLIALLSGLGMATGMLGLIVIIPWIAHASWHAYCDMTSRPGSSSKI